MIPHNMTFHARTVTDRAARYPIVEASGRICERQLDPVQLTFDKSVIAGLLATACGRPGKQ